MNEEDAHHPVWDVYDEHRTARLNVKYHAARLQWLQRSNLIVEILIAVTASSSAIAAWRMWNVPGGREAWQVLAALAGVLAVLKPILRLPEAMRRREELLGGYRVLDHDIRTLCIAIRQAGSFSQIQRERFDAALDRKRALVAQERETRPVRWLLRRCHEEVCRELPADRFFIPGGLNE